MNRATFAELEESRIEFLDRNFFDLMSQVEKIISPDWEIIKDKVKIHPSFGDLIEELEMKDETRIDLSVAVLNNYRKRNSG